MKYVILAGALVLASTAAMAQYNPYGRPAGTGSNPNSHTVPGHSNSNGTYTQPHTRTNPNSSTQDNYGAPGNYNPSTGRTGR